MDSSPGADGIEAMASDGSADVARAIDGLVEQDAKALPTEPDAPSNGLEDAEAGGDSADSSRRDLRKDAGDGARSDAGLDVPPADATTGTGAAGAAGTIGAGGAGGITTGSGGAGGAGLGGAGGSTSGDASFGCTASLPGDAGARLSEGLVAHYQCEETSGNVLSDSSGNSADGTLVSGTGGSAGFAYGSGKTGQAVYFSAAHQGYAMLPSTLLAGAQEATVATWVYVNNAVDWQRIFDFGKPESDGTSKVYMYLAAAEDARGRLHFAISTTGPGDGEQSMDGPVLSTKTWHHVAVVLGPSGGRLYVDGCRVDSDSRMSFRPADLPHPLDYYIGLSQWGLYPVNLDANIDEFRVYARALDAEEIQALAAGL